MIYKEEKEICFLIDTKAYVLAHCISADVTATKAMGAGIAKIFRRKYKNISRNDSSSLRVGKSVRYEEDGMSFTTWYPSQRFIKNWFRH